MPVLVAILLGASALAFVLYPLYRRTSVKILALATTVPSETESPQAERESAARKALQEIELDFQLGNLAEADYRSLRERYMQRALRALKVRRDREQEIDEMIEVRLKEMKEKEREAEELDDEI